MNDTYAQSLFNRPSEEEVSLPPSGIASNSWVIGPSPPPPTPPWGPDIDPFKKKMDDALRAGNPAPPPPGWTDLLQHYSTLVLHLQSEIRRLTAELEKRG